MVSLKLRLKPVEAEVEDEQKAADALKDELLEGFPQVFVEVEHAPLNESLLYLFQLPQLVPLTGILRLVFLGSN